MSQPTIKEEIEKLLNDERLLAKKIARLICEEMTGKCCEEDAICNCKENKAQEILKALE